MEFAVVGWPDEGPTLDLDHREFSYAGKFVMSSTGKAVAREDGDVVGAVAFDADRTDPSTLVIRYVTVRQDRKGEGIGPELVSFVVDAAAEEGYDRARIAVNNAYSYEALYKAGFEYTGEESGIAELVLERPTDPDAVDDPGAVGDPDPDRYREGMAVFADRDLDPAEREFVREKREAGPPERSDR